MRRILVLLFTTLLFAGSANAVLFTGTPALVIADGVGDTTPSLDYLDTSGVFGPGDTIISISVSVTLSHTWVGDLAIELISPDGPELPLLARPGSSAGNEATGNPFGNPRNLVSTTLTFAGGATSAETRGGSPPNNIPDGTYAPAPDGWLTDISTLAEFIGLQADGIWTLRVGDYANGDTGTFESWSLDLVAVPEPSSHLLVTLGLLGISIVGRKRRD